MIPQGAQYECMLPKIIMLCNHWALLVDLSKGEPFSLVPVGDFQLEDNIFQGMPGDNLLYTSEELTKLCRMRFQVAMHQPAQTSVVCPEGGISTFPQFMEGAQFNQQAWGSAQSHRLPGQEVFMLQAFPTFKGMPWIP